MHKIENSLAKLKHRLQQAALQAHREAQDIQLLAVSKTQPASVVRMAYQAGQQVFGENYLQEALDKQQQLGDLAIEWHFIGSLQSNKTRAIAENFDWVHSVDRVTIAQRLSSQRPISLKPLNLCLQLNIDSEASKSGLTLTELTTLATEVITLPNLVLRGLMVIPAPRKDFAVQLAVFQQAADALKQLQRIPGLESLDTLSMGMSADLEAAVCAGATIVRIGTDIFGPRLAL